MNRPAWKVVEERLDGRIGKQVDPALPKPVVARSRAGQPKGEWLEMPRCSNPACGHRRIAHHAGLSVATNGRIVREEREVPCSMPGCTCVHYITS